MPVASRQHLKCIRRSTSHLSENQPDNQLFRTIDRPSVTNVMCTNNCSVSVTIMDLIYNKTTISNTLKKIIITKVGRGKSKKGVLIKKI